MITLKRSQHNLKLIRRFGEDIWGRLALTQKPLRVLNYLYEAYQNSFKHRTLLKSSKKSFFLVRKKPRFLYKIVSDEKEFRRRKRTLKIANYLMRLKLRRFYGNLGKTKLKRVLNKPFLYSNVMGRAFAYFLEGRLDVILYRSNFFTSIFAARQYISHNKVLINGLVVNKPSYIVSLHDVITLRNIEILYISLKERLKSRSILVNHPSYLEVNYKIGAISLVMLPDVKSVPFPFFMNLENFSHNFFR